MVVVAQMARMVRFLCFGFGCFGSCFGCVVVGVVGSDLVGVDWWDSSDVCCSSELVLAASDSADRSEVIDGKRWFGFFSRHFRMMVSKGLEIDMFGLMDRGVGGGSLT